LKLRNLEYRFRPSPVFSSTATAFCCRSLTMASQKPAALPPDTAHAGGDPPPSVLQDAVGHNSAENPESLDSQVPKNR
jgi:hypothetical protein